MEVRAGKVCRLDAGVMRSSVTAYTHLTDPKSLNTDQRVHSPGEREWRRRNLVLALLFGYGRLTCRGGVLRGGYNKRMRNYMPSGFLQCATISPHRRPITDRCIKNVILYTGCGHRHPLRPASGGYAAIDYRILGGRRGKEMPEMLCQVPGCLAGLGFVSWADRRRRLRPDDTIRID